jgi:hypothetical protein
MQKLSQFQIITDHAEAGEI